MLPASFLGKTACCFTGHRCWGLPAGGREQSEEMIALKRALLLSVLEAVQMGVSTFLAGGAEGFDLLAAEAALACRGDWPQVHLVLALPSRTVASNYPVSIQERYDRVLAAASDVYYASETYNGAASMLRRNRYLVDHADCCISYLHHMTGGTLYTVNYALEQNIPVFNLYEYISV